MFKNLAKTVSILIIFVVTLKHNPNYENFSAAQIKNGDLFTIKNEPIASVHLMEKAAMACTDFIHHKYLKTKYSYFLWP